MRHNQHINYARVAHISEEVDCTLAYRLFTIYYYEKKNCQQLVVVANVNYQCALKIIPNGGRFAGFCT